MFGRVNEGIEVLGKIRRVDPSKREPVARRDKIVKATVLRKREHEYVPKKVGEP